MDFDAIVAAVDDMIMNGTADCFVRVDGVEYPCSNEEECAASYEAMGMGLTSHGPYVVRARIGSGPCDPAHEFVSSWRFPVLNGDYRATVAVP